MAIAHLFDGVGGEDTDRVNRALVQAGPCQFLLFQMWHENRAPLCANGKRYGQVAARHRSVPRCVFVYQPFTIETLIFIQSLDGTGMRFLAVSQCALICRQLSSIPHFGQRKSHQMDAISPL